MAVLGYLRGPYCEGHKVPATVMVLGIIRNEGDVMAPKLLCHEVINQRRGVCEGAA
jgi:hypothetical protein